MIYALLSSGADGRNVPNIVCKIYFNGSTPCFGGVMALEGRTGKELWRHYTPHEVYGLNCNADLNKDGIADCLAGGRAGVSISILNCYLAMFKIELSPIFYLEIKK